MWETDPLVPSLPPRLIVASATAERSRGCRSPGHSRRSAPSRWRQRSLTVWVGDSESTQVGYVDVASGLNPTWPLPDEHCSRTTAVRLLGLSRRYDGGSDAATSAPKVLKDYLAAVAKHHSVEPESLLLLKSDLDSHRSKSPSRLELAHAVTEVPLVVRLPGATRWGLRGCATAPHAPVRRRLLEQWLPPGSTRGTTGHRGGGLLRGWQRSPCAVWPSPS